MPTHPVSSLYNLGCVQSPVQSNVWQTSWIMMEYSKLSINISRDVKRRDLLGFLDTWGSCSPQQQVYVWLNALQNSGSRCDPLLGAKIVKELLPKSEVERCHTFVRAIKLVLQGLDESCHNPLCVVPFILDADLSRCELVN